MSRAEDDLTSPARDYAPRLCELGTVGWEGREELTELGTENNDGHTFVCVTLYAGRTQGVPVKKGVAQGREVLCGINVLSGFTIPPRGTRVYVLFPSGMEEAPGAGVIVAAVAPGPEVKANAGTGDRTFSAASGQARVVVKANGAVTIFTTTDNTPTGKAVAFTLSPTKLAFAAPWGSFVFDASGLHVKTKAGPRFDMGGVLIPGIPSEITEAISAYIKFTAPQIRLNGALVKLGVGPNYGTALQAPSSALTAGAIPVTTGPSSQSPSVWVSVP